jgi:hypothetical protein
MSILENKDIRTEVNSINLNNIKIHYPLIKRRHIYYNKLENLE